MDATNVSHPTQHPTFVKQSERIPLSIPLLLLRHTPVLYQVWSYHCGEHVGHHSDACNDNDACEVQSYPHVSTSFMLDRNQKLLDASGCLVSRSSRFSISRASAPTHEDERHSTIKNSGLCRSASARMVGLNMHWYFFRGPGDVNSCGGSM